MNKYIRGGVCLTFTNIKFAWLKLLRGKNFSYSPISVCSPMCEVTVDKGGALCLSKNLKMRSHTHIRVRKNGVIGIGENVAFGYGNIITAHERVIIGNNVQFSPNVLVYDHDHDFRTKDGLKNLLFKTSPVEIGNNVWIGANSIILRGTKIGDNCVIAAGSVVKGNIPDGTIFVQKKDSELISIN